ncbi:MAG: DNA polymerase III subunit gamma/tau [Chlorobiaceae bacterium]|nr:DNA polymerase III subunit gamma/tau [Chlorobiaceae bacterium]
MGAWQEKLSGFASHAAPRKKSPSASMKAATQAGAESHGISADLQSLKLEWHQFLEHISKKSRNFMSAHLESCALEACRPGGIVEIACCRKFSYEELLQERKLLQKELSEFYQLPLEVHLRYDAEKDACTKEKSVFTLFGELSLKNEVIRYIIREFGGELVY